MVGENLKFTEKENKIRTSWLTTLLIVPLLDWESISTLEFQMMIFVFLICFLSFCLNYYCAYKKPGTALLLFAMIGSFLDLGFFFYNVNLPTMLASSTALALALKQPFISCVIFWTSYRLRKVNANMQERILKASPEYLNARAVFSTANNLEELNQK